MSEEEIASVSEEDGIGDAETAQKRRQRELRDLCEYLLDLMEETEFYASKLEEIGTICINATDASSSFVDTILEIVNHVSHSNVFSIDIDELYSSEDSITSDEDEMYTDSDTEQNNGDDETSSDESDDDTDEDTDNGLDDEIEDDSDEDTEVDEDDIDGQHKNINVTENKIGKINDNNKVKVKNGAVPKPTRKNVAKSHLKNKHEVNAGNFSDESDIEYSETGNEADDESTLSNTDSEKELKTRIINKKLIRSTK